ncbi:MAG: porphobilinogen synthase [Candidatus Latescibacterota bacterium]|nr:MAG: porphobilinogen synthase [Candidatus Latescibacterota bacterium]
MCTVSHEFPRARPRRLRFNPELRRMTEETQLGPADFIYPLFVRPGKGIRKPIPSMPGQFQLSIDELTIEVEKTVKLGIPAVILFGIPDKKDACGSDNFDPDGIVPTAIRAVKETSPEIVVVSDMCFCEYTDHGHCGVINTRGEEHFNPAVPEGYLLNDPTLELLGRASVVHARAGADIIAPSGMLDGMVNAIRTALDGESFDHVAIMSYAAKYSSGFYGPFREAAESAPGFGDRSQYQMDPGNVREAIKEIELDVNEGADILMVKPAMPYLDVISAARDRFNQPIAAYQVSGEFSMIHAAAANGWLDLERCALESLRGIKRAGADMILTYFAPDAVKWLGG